jgi:hypothetical protein
MMREPKDKLVGNTNKNIGGEIPDLEGAMTGLLGVKAPASYRQTDDIQDRLRAAGVKMPPAFVVKS